MIARYDGPPFMTAELVWWNAPVGERCLRFIDPYGDTIFNYLQIPVLIQELNDLLPYVDNTQSEVIHSLCKFLNQAVNGDYVRPYVKFIGD